MKKSIIGIITILLIVGSIGSVFCGQWIDGVFYSDWSDPSKTTFWLNDKQVTGQEFYSEITKEALKGAKGTVQYSDLVNGTAPSSSIPTLKSESSKGEAPKVKLTVWFTDALGRIIGSSQVTKGTDIADSQFPAEVSDCEGMAFDHWDYDGRLIEHEYIVRAIYK